MGMRLTAGCVMILLAVFAWPNPARAQDEGRDLEVAVTETIWGFDGKGVRETFTPLSILVQNNGSKAASGTFRLLRQVPLDNAREPAIEIPFDIPAFEERWVQAAPYLLDEYTPWQITWGPHSKQQLELSQPRLGDPAHVLLVNPNDRPRSSGVLRRFRSNLFPSVVTATDGLEAVFLNSVPDIQGARLQTFLEWLQRGGRLFLLHGDDRQYPKFPTALAALNDPTDSFQVGNGEVRRLPHEAAEMDEAQLRQTFKASRATSSRETTAAFQDPYKTYYGGFPWSRDRAVLEGLESVSRFHRRWWLIYPLAALYLLAIFPGSYAIAHSARGVRRFYVAYFATAVVFSWAFSTLGGVGGGDKNRIRSATIAHQISPGVFDCSQWSSLAAVSGGWFALSHQGSGRLYSPCEEFEVPRGLITAGTDAKYEVDIPVASTRTAVSRFRATAPPVRVQLRSIDIADRKLNSCTVVFEGLPAKPLEAYICHRDSLLRLQENGDAWSTDRRRSMATSVFITHLDQIPNYTLTTRGKTVAQSVSEDFYRSLERALVGNAFQTRARVEPASAKVPPGRVRVMALVQSDQAFAAIAPGFEDVQGCVLYVIDLPVSEN